MPRPHCSLILAMLLLWQSHYSAAQPALEGGIGFARPCGEDNLSCPRLDEALQCYTQAELCNGIQDCDGGSDEGQDLVSLECSPGRPEESVFVCTPGEQIPISALCDGNMDCKVNGDDETTTLCENKCLLPYYGGCPYTRECITSEFDVNCGDCFPGYKEDPLNPFPADCIDIDECANKKTPCSPYAKCINTEGSFLCECKPGFTGDGIVCIRDRGDETPKTKSSTTAKSGTKGGHGRRNYYWRRLLYYLYHYGYFNGHY